MMHLDQDLPTKPSRKGKERDSHHVSSHRNTDSPQPTDLAERMIALQRKRADALPRRERIAVPQSSTSRPDKSPKPSPIMTRPSPTRKHPHPSPHLTVSRPSVDADHEDFSRRLKISSPGPRPSPSSRGTNKLFNPDTDPIPIRRTAEPESISDATSSSYVPRASAPHPQHHRGADGPGRQLFDPRKDDPVRFSVSVRPGRPTPTPKSSGDYVSASSTSSYANSMVSSSFTLSSNTTDNSSASSALFERNGGGHHGSEEHGNNNVFAIQLKKLYRSITALEAKIKQEDSVDEGADEGGMSGSGRIMLKGKEIEDDEEVEKEKWKKQISDHKRLAEQIHNLLEISLAPSVPASLRNIPTKYNIIVRLWSYAFHKLLESLRRQSFTSPFALEHLQDFIYYAYTFYTGLVEDPMLSTFKSGWLEALGDLARYRIAVAAMVTGSMGSGEVVGLTTAAVDKVSTAAAVDADPSTQDINMLAPPAVDRAKSVSDVVAARIDDSPSPSIGLAAARLMDVEPEKERWRKIARDWYGAGLADTPGAGKLHHHLGLLSRDVEGEELRGVYHFAKSMITLHPFMTSRESVLPIWSAPAQARRSLPDARVPDLFVLLHGMLFTNIELDDFDATFARFMERLEIEGAEEREWIMMAVVNISAVYEYGKPVGVLKRVAGIGSKEDVAGVAAGVAGMRVIARARDEEKMDVDEETEGADQSKARSQASPPMSEVEGEPPLEFPMPFKLALRLTFAILTHVLRTPTRKSSPYARSSLNPYLTVLLTFLATVLKHRQTLEVLERSIPWEELARFFATVPRNIMRSQGLMEIKGGPLDERWIMLTSGCAPPLDEDWCLRGMEWVGRRVYERGFWKSGEERRAEIEVLDEEEGGEVTDGQIEDDNDDDQDSGRTSDMYRRWVRIVRCGVSISGVVDGLAWTEGSRDWRIEGCLSEKVARWKEEDEIERQEEERRRMGTRWADDSMDVDEDASDSLSEESDDDDNDSEEVKALKARRRYLRNLLQSSQHESTVLSLPRPRQSSGRRGATSRPALHIVAGYTVLVVDTNILLSSLAMLSSVIETLRWTVVVPLPVIMELDGLSSNTSQLGEAAQTAMAYVTSHVRSHSTSLKVQTSKGNYLTSLSVRTEQVDFTSANSDRNMDDLILKAAIWQDEHWVDRTAMLKTDGSRRDTVGAVKVVLLSLDRNLRLKARSRQLPAASEKDLASILATGT